MSRFILTFIIISTSLFLKAQPVITDNNYPRAGESYTGVYTTLTSGEWNPGMAGANQTWDFSSLPTSTSGTVNYQDPASTTYASSYTGANVAITEAGIATLYYDRNVNQVDIMGSVTLFPATNNRPNIDPQTVVTFPFTYNNTVTDVASTAKSAYGSGMQKRSTSSNTLADGYGTLILPGPTNYSNVLRIRIASEVIDSTYDAGGTYLSRSITIDTQYYFIAQSYKPHLLVLDKNVSGSTTLYLAQYLTTPTTPTSIIKQSGEYLKVYPNPTSTEVFLELDQNRISNKGSLVFEVSTSTGIPVFSVNNINNTKQKITLSNLNPGIYYYQLKSNEEIIDLGKLIIQ